MTKLRLALGLVTALVLTNALAYAILWAFAPRWLLLDARTAGATLPLAFAAAAGGTVVVAAYVVVRVGRLRLARKELEAAELLETFALSRRVAVAHVAVTAAASLATLTPWLRPVTNDVDRQAALVLLTLTVMSTSALPLYLLARSVVARTLEGAPREVSREAIGLLERMPDRLPRVRTRFLAAVAAPVAFVAVGASLLVYSHARAFEARARESDAQAIARGALDLVSGSDEGRLDAMLAARRLGFYVDVERAPTPEHVAPVAYGDQLAVRVPLDDASAEVHFEPLLPAPGTFVFVVAALVVAALAAVIGARIGGSLADDVLLATGEIQKLGAADVIRGTGLTAKARFAGVRALRDAIDRLGAVFRQFASVQERAIDARGATERMRGLFLASMSHDLKGPLNAILGFAELASRAELGGAQRESLAIIEQRGKELLALVQTILDSARIEAGQLHLERAWTKVGDVVMAAVLDARELVHGTDVQIAGEIQPGVPKVWVDAIRLASALVAIVTSTVRLVPQGHIVVRATLPSDADRLRIDVEARGRVSVAEERERIFEAFRDPARARKQGSLGLGLWLARAVVELHGGAVEFRPGDDGSLAFSVWLPVDPPGASTDQWRAQAG